MEHQIVRIPDLGSFSIGYKEAEIHPILHTFTPPGNYVQFSENPLESDTEFVGFVAQKKGCEWETARKIVSDWVNLLKKELKASSFFEMGSLGKFTQGAVHYEFTPALDPDLSATSYGLPSFTITRNPVPTTENNCDTEREPASPEKSCNPKESSIPDSPASTEKLSGAEESSSPEKSSSLEGTSSHKETSDTPKSTKHKKHIGRKIFIGLAVLFLLCVISLAVFAFLYPISFELKKMEYVHKAEMLFQKKNNTLIINTTNQAQEDAEKAFWDDKKMLMEQTPVQSDSSSHEGTHNEEPSSKDSASSMDNFPDNTSINQKNGTEKAYIIIGGFGNAENADKLVNKIKSQYPLAKNLGLNEKGTLYMVGIGPLSEKEAENQRTKLLSIYSDCWILIK